MKIEHLAMWTTELDRLKDFYVRFFGVMVSDKYVNPRRAFESYFLSFASGARLEIMRRADLAPREADDRVGLSHVALSVGSTARVDALTQELRSEGYVVVDGPRWTGDGYYESVILDPDGNRIELTE